MDSTLIAAASLAGFDAAKGWPETLEPAQAVALQCRRLGARLAEYNSHPDTRELTESLRLAVKAGAVVLKTWTETKLVDVPPPQPHAQAFGQGASWETYSGHRNETEGQRRERLWRAAHPTVKRPKTVTHSHITPESFAAWLAENDTEPSRYVAAWFKSQAVDLDRRPIAPPKEWTAQSAHGLQRFDGTDAGRLVRLADLVQWMMDARELPCKHAVEEVCTALEQRPRAAGGWLYLLQRNDYATPLPPEHSFYWLPTKAPADDNPGDPNDNGLTGAINNMRSHWTESPTIDAVQSDSARGLAPLAIRVDVAYLLWGYGRRVEVAEQTQAAATMPATAAMEKRRVLKKNALIAEVETEWLTIGADLKEASRNGLSEAAHTEKGWDVEHAKGWADSKGKLKKTEAERAAPATWLGPGKVHRIK